MLAGDLAHVARAALTEGPAGLARFAVQLLRPVQPMLAEPPTTSADALDRTRRRGRSMEARRRAHPGAQVGRRGAGLLAPPQRRDAWPCPRWSTAVRALPARELILDGEVIALEPDGSPHPFQTTMSRFGRRLDVERARGARSAAHAFPLRPALPRRRAALDDPQAARSRALARLRAGRARRAAPLGASAEEAEAFLDDALARGHEGVMAKSPARPYEAGRRGRAGSRSSRPTRSTWSSWPPSGDTGAAAAGEQPASGRARSMTAAAS